MGDIGNLEDTGTNKLPEQVRPLSYAQPGPDATVDSSSIAGAAIPTRKAYQPGEASPHLTTPEQASAHDAILAEDIAVAAEHKSGLTRIGEFAARFGFGSKQTAPTETPPANPQLKTQEQS